MVGVPVIGYPTMLRSGVVSPAVVSSRRTKSDTHTPTVPDGVARRMSHALPRHSAHTSVQPFAPLSRERRQQVSLRSW